MLSSSAHRVAQERTVKHRMAMLSFPVLELSVEQVDIFIGQNFKYIFRIRIKPFICAYSTVRYHTLQCVFVCLRVLFNL